MRGCKLSKSAVKFSEVLQYSGGLSNKVSKIIRRHIDKLKLLLICITNITFLHIFMFYLHQCLWGCIHV